MILFAMSATGCIGENLNDCPECRLVFRYTWNNENVDQLTTHVKDIDVYVFDMATRLLVDVIEVGRADIARGWIEIDDLASGEYTFVAWGGSGTEMSRNFDVNADAVSRVGTITLEEFYLMLDSDDIPAGSTGQDVGDIVPAAEDFDDPLFAMAGDVPIVEVDFIRDTNVLKVTVTGLEHLWNHNGNGGTPASAKNQPLDLFVVGRNSIYRWDNTIDPDALRVRYEQPYHSLTADTMRVDIKTMRLDIDRHTNDPVRLYVRNAETGHDMVAPLDVVDVITHVRDADGKLLWPDQEAIDREYEFPFEISILHDLNVRVSIGKWVVVDTSADIGRP